MYTGYENADYGMSGYYRKADYIQDYNDMMEQMQPECLSVAEEIYQDFAFAESEEEYRANGFDREDHLEAWHDWLLEESADKDESGLLRQAMEHAIEYTADFTSLEWIAERIKADDDRKAKYAKAFDEMMGMAV